LVPERYHEQYEKGLEGFKDTGRGDAIGKTLELIALRKNGEEIPIELSLSAVKLHGKWNAVGVVRDITELRQVEYALYQEHKQLLSILDSMDEPVYVADPQTYDLLYMNDALKRITGADAGQKCYSALQGRDAPCLFCTNDRIFGDNVGTTHIWEFQNELDKNWYRCIDKAIVWPDGRLVRFELGINIQDIKDAEAELEEYRIHLEDLVEARTDELAEANEKLQESQKRYHTVADFTYDWEYWVDTDGNVIYVSPSCERITGYLPDDFMRDPDIMKKIVHPDDRDIVFDHRHEVFPGGNASPIDFRIITPDGEERWIGHLCQPVYDDKGNSLGRRGSNRDITERKRAEEDLKEYVDDLEHSNEMKDIFTDIIRHDLLNPINVIKGFTGLLLKTETDESKLLQLEKIKHSNERLIEMIQNASKFSKLDATEKIQLETADIGVLMKKAASSLERESNEKQMAIELPVCGLYSARVNSMIEDVFVNLLSNAIKYSPTGSRVMIDVLDAGGMWKVTVTDAGEGVSDENKPLVFERLKRVHKKGVKGSGLGLAIVKRIIDLHGGDVGVEDNPQGQGSVFWVSVQKA
ncbi:MAG: PAS domain S-box protein, partial [Euryarchaeota archaeon]|nr:PAS domain S-box protein [Euryarchaeota archaeon]